MTLGMLARDFVFYTGLACLSAAVVWVMTYVGVIDVPGARSSHSRPTPKGGGVGIAAAFFVGVASIYAFASFGGIAPAYFPTAMVAAAGIAIVAYLDDVFGWPAVVKLACQVVASLLVMYAGLDLMTLRHNGAGFVAVGWIAPIATVVWIVIVTNAVNFMDGLNGLASGVVCLASLMLAILGAWHADAFVYIVCLILSASIFGFLPFNFPSARIFMGDVGSQFCGFMIAVLGISVGRDATVELSLLLLPMILAGLLFDVALTLVRRALAGESLTQAHRSHLYQLAHRSGMSAVGITLVHWAFVIWGAACWGLFLQAVWAWKLVFVLAVVPPQLWWWRYVDQLATRAEVPRPLLRRFHRTT